MGRRWTWVLAGLAVLGALLYGAGPAARVLVSSADAVRASGWQGLAAFACVYAIATWLLVPGSWLHATAGALFGPVLGGLGGSLASALLSLVSFTLGRTVLRPFLRTRGGRLLAVLDRTVRDGGAGAVTLVRAAPISPYNLVSYALGATDVRPRDYLLGTVVGGMVPALLWATVGATASDLTSVVTGQNTGPSWVRWVGLAVTLGAVSGVLVLVRRSVSTLEAPGPVTPAGGP